MKALPPLVLLHALGLTACVESLPLPDLGRCAERPEGVYEYGQVGIGTCLAGPVALEVLDGGDVLAVANANPFLDFTGGSLLFLDTTRLDLSQPRHDVADLAVASVDLESFAGGMAFASDQGLLAVTTRLSEGARTREADDTLVLVDVSDPRAPTLATDAGEQVTVGWDPVDVRYDAGTQVAWVANRTEHTVSLVDLAARPARVLPPGGPARLTDEGFVDVDGSGSTFGFVTLEAGVDALVAERSAWSLRWSEGSVRAWVGAPDGFRRWDGNADGGWWPSSQPREIDLDALGLPGAGGASLAVGETLPRLVMHNALHDAIHAVSTPETLFDWQLEAVALLRGRPGQWDALVSDPAMVVQDGVWYLFYTGRDAADDATPQIGLATSVDGVRFERFDGEGRFALSDAGGAASLPTLTWDAVTRSWLMAYLAGDGVYLARSGDLVRWTELNEQLAIGAETTGDLALARWGGKFQLMATLATAGRWSAQGWSAFDPAGRDDLSVWPFYALVPSVDLPVVPGVEAPSLAIQVQPEQAFALFDEGGDRNGTLLEPGATLVDASEGWAVRVAVGQAVEPALAGWSHAAVGSLLRDGDGTAVVELVDENGATAIGFGYTDGDGLALAESPAITAAGLGVDAVRSPVVVEGGGAYAMYFAVETDGVTRVARATSADGLVWDTSSGVVLDVGSGWDSVAVEPGSVETLDDGTLRLWYSGFDGDRWRIGAAESDDGGRSWTRGEGEDGGWQLAGGDAGSWDDAGVRDPWVVSDGAGGAWMAYAGLDGSRWAIGVATRSEDTGAWRGHEDATGVRVPVLDGRDGGFGLEGLRRPVLDVVGNEGWELWYAGLDGGVARPGRATGDSPEALYRHLLLPTTADVAGFTSIPEQDDDAIALDTTVDGNVLNGLGCTALAQDAARGLVYVGCKLRPWVYVIDARDDSVPGDPDLNYLDLEAVILVETSTNGLSSSTGMGSGIRGMVVDPERGWLWGVSDEPEALYALDLSTVEDDDDAQVLREPIVAMHPLPRSGSRDEGAKTQALVGPAALALHPDGHHLLVANFNHNSVSAFDLAAGPAGALVAQVERVGENPYALAYSPDGRLAYVGNYVGEVDGRVASATLAVLDADPASPTFLRLLTTVGNLP